MSAPKSSMSILKIAFGGYNSKVRNCLKRAFSVQKVPQDMIEYRRQMDLRKETGKKCKQHEESSLKRGSQVGPYKTGYEIVST